jgi:hypothetical protein
MINFLLKKFRCQQKYYWTTFLSILFLTFHGCQSWRLWWLGSASVMSVRRPCLPIAAASWWWWVRCCDCIAICCWGRCFTVTEYEVFRWSPMANCWWKGARSTNKMIKINYIYIINFGNKHRLHVLCIENHPLSVSSSNWCLRPSSSWSHRARWRRGGHSCSKLRMLLFVGHLTRCLTSELNLSYENFRRAKRYLCCQELSHLLGPYRET